MDYLADNLLLTRLLHINASKPFGPLHLLPTEEVDTGLAILKLISHYHLGRRIHQLSRPREHPVSSVLVCDMRRLLVLRVRST